MILAQVTPADTMIQQASDTLQQAMDSAAQVVTDSAAAIAAAAAPVAEAAEPIVKELSMWELIKAGGWFIMIPLALLAIASFSCCCWLTRRSSCVRTPTPPMPA